MNMKIGEQIAILRKQRGLTQEELAKLLGVTNQAVSKWEANKCCPDIELLPKIATVFHCSIDKLFNFEKVFTDTGNTYELCTEFPWNDDEIIRGVVCKGRKILSIKDEIMNKFTFEFEGEAKSVKSHCNLSVLGNVTGGCNAGNDISVVGDIGGSCNAGHTISNSGNISGACAAGHSMSVGGSINGDVGCGNSLICKNIIGNVECKAITVEGDVTAEKIKGNVECHTLKCDDIEGEVKIN